MTDRRLRHFASCTTCWSSSALIVLVMISVVFIEMPTVFSQPVDGELASFLVEADLEPSSWDWSDSSLARCRSEFLGLLDDSSADTESKSGEESDGEVDGQFLHKRPTRRIGSEFLGKRSVRLGKTVQQLEQICHYLENNGETTEDHLICHCFRRQGGDPSEEETEYSAMKRGLGSIFLSGKREANSKPASPGTPTTSNRVMNRRMMGSEFLGKRAIGHEFLGKRAMGSEFLGKRGGPMGNEFLGKRVMGSEFLGKRAMGHEFLGKRSIGSEFLGKRAMGSEFLGKRAMGNEFLGKRSTSVNDEKEKKMSM